MENEIKCPYIIFKLNNSLYCINSKHVSTIVQIPEYSTIPAAPANVTGMFKYRDQVIQMLDLRITFGLKSIASECSDFEAMIDARKQDHINWVKELERYITEGGTFSLAKDSHQCALGKWYDRYTTDNQAVSSHLRKMEEPHEKLHQSAALAEYCMRNKDDEEQQARLSEILRLAKEEYMPTILTLLDQTKEIFRSSIFKEMVLILDGLTWGIVVDEIVSVEDLEVIAERQQEPIVNRSSFIGNVMESSRQESLIFELDIQNLIMKLAELESAF
ncbi:CZB domain-containing protein [Lacrimispora sp.]|uniref:CZB domain-containing protein n=1 Tax=Lacrimispora sp. TaxID=2719234 RepID=UPI003995BB6C